MVVKLVWKVIIQLNSIIKMKNGRQTSYQGQTGTVRYVKIIK
ncbi:hypothetical protein Nizo1840_0303 [Lactiplantibacillus plantarum]|nr:hypothetical protein SF2A35B_1721 [Lactiplantibacillus plantarum]KZT89405.1 hypothetical protein Nizo1840_0303 [Lactiplantibacillus plantarum]KZU15970.1 hypothetical protein Nizo2264_0100 [Lactiplantibacillus plantarum]